MKHLLFVILLSFLTSCVEQIEPIDENAEPTKILRLKSDQIGQTKANILLSLELKGGAYLEYGVTQSYGQITNKKNAEFDHVFKLENLKEDTIYHYRAVVVDKNLNRVVSKNYQFKTLKKVVIQPKLQIVQIKASDLKQTSAKVTWKTNILADGIVYFGTTSNLGLSSAKVSILKKDHAHELKNLKEDTTYYYQVNSNGKVSAKSQFKTLKKVVTPPNPTSPVISSIAITSISETGAKVSWKTDKPSKSILTYGESSNLSLTKNDNSFKRDHVATLSGLKDDQTYYFKIKVTDQDNLSVISGQRTFKTKKKEVQITPVAPILSSAKKVGSDYVLTWKLPSGTVGTPSGGYDVSVDGTEIENLDHTVLSKTIAGLDEEKKHCFKIEARWLQTEPKRWLRSNELCVEGTMSPPPVVDPEGSYLRLSNFKVKNSDKSRVYFDSNIPFTATSTSGFTITDNSIESVRVQSGKTSGHYFVLKTPFDFWDNNTIRYKGGSNFKDTKGGSLKPFTLQYIKNEIPEPNSPTIRYVSATANGRGDGKSLSAPWTLSQAMASATAGMTVWVKAGDYESKEYLAKNNGTSTRPIKFVGYKRTPGDNPKLTRSQDTKFSAKEMPYIHSTSKKGSGLSIYGRKYIILRNFQVSGYHKTVEMTLADYSIADNIYAKNGYININSFPRYRSQQLRVINSYVHNASMDGIVLSGARHLIDNVYASSRGKPSMDYYIVIVGGNVGPGEHIIRNSDVIRDPNDTHTGHGISLKAQSRPIEHTLVEDCFLKDVGQALEIRHSKVRYNVGRRIKATGGNLVTFRDATSYNSLEDSYGYDLYKGIAFGMNAEEDQGIQAGGFNNKVINTVIHNARYHISVTGIDGVIPLKSLNNEFINVTFHGGKYLFVGYEDFDESNTFTNCIFSEVPLRRYTKGKYAGQLTAVFQYSNFFKAWKKEPGKGNISVDPKFVDTSKGNFHLKKGSQCIDKGLDSSGVYFDYDGVSRSQGRGADMGAFEYK